MKKPKPITLTPARRRVLEACEAGQYLFRAKRRCRHALGGEFSLQPDCRCKAKIMCLHMIECGLLKKAFPYPGHPVFDYWTVSAKGRQALKAAK